MPESSPSALRRRVFGLAWPVISENLLETMLAIVDTILVAGLGTVAVAGVGSAVQVMFFLIAILSALAIGNSVLVAQAVGARELERAGRLARQSLVWAAIFSLPLAGAGLLLSEHIIGVFGMEPAVTEIGVGYLQVTMGTVVVLVGLFIGGGVLRGAGDSRTPMVVTALANVLNVGLTYALIYGHVGLPQLGAVGSAWGTFIARGFALSLLLGVLWRGRNGVTIRGRGVWRPHWPVARDILRLGLPAALEQILVSSAFFLLTIVVAGLGTNVLAAHRISMNALTFSFLPGIGFGVAATALVGQSIGARRPREGLATARTATLWAVVWMSTIAALIVLFADPIMRVFSSDPALVAVGASGLRVMAFTQPFWAVLFVNAGSLRGCGNTRYPLVVTGGGVWVSVGLGFLLVSLLGGDLMAAWAGFLIVSPVMAWLHWRRLHRELAGAPAPLQ